MSNRSLRHSGKDDWKYSSEEARDILADEEHERRREERYFAEEERAIQAEEAALDLERRQAENDFDPETKVRAQYKNYTEE